MTAGPGPAPQLPSVPASPEDETEWHAVRVTGDGSGVVAAGVEVLDAVLDGCRLAGAELPELRVADSAVLDADLSGALVDGSTWRRVRFERCRLTGIDLSSAQLDDVVFVGCKLDEADLRLARGRKVRFEDCVLTGADLYGAQLPGTVFAGCDLRGADLSQADLSGAALAGSQLDGVRGLPVLRGAVVDGTQLVEVAVWLCAALGITVADDASG